MQTPSHTADSPVTHQDDINLLLRPAATTTSSAASVTTNKRRKYPAKNNRREFTTFHRSAVVNAATASSQFPTKNNQRLQHTVHPAVLSHSATAVSSNDCPATSPSRSVVRSAYLPDEGTNMDIANNTRMPPPMLSVAPSAKRTKWFYVTRFLPHETSENMIMYISSKCNCDPSSVKCIKLAGQTREDNRPLSFL